MEQKKAGILCHNVCGRGGGRSGKTKRAQIRRGE